MSLGKIMIKSALVTLAVVVGCVVAIFAILSLGFPRTMCGWCEQFGNYGFAVRYASLYYSYTGNVEDLGRCVDDSILSESDGDIIEYADQLVDHAEFASYCVQRDEDINESISGEESFDGLVFSYRQYVFGALASSYYYTGEEELAVGTAVSALDPGVDRAAFSPSAYNGDISGFPVNNALGSLALKVLNSRDSQTAAIVLDVFGDVTPENMEEAEYLITLTAALQVLVEA